MLRRLIVHRLSLVDHVEFSFERGFTVLTGETGAGKSMILHAMDLVLGARASADDVKQGESQAVVEASFEIKEPRVSAWLKEKGYEMEEELVIRRTISKEGKSQAYVNGSLAPLSVLRDLGSWLADVHGQHEQQTLLRSATHLEALDTFGQLESVRQTVEEQYRLWHDQVMKRQTLMMDEQERARQLDLLAFQKEELESARIQPGEEETWSREREVLRHAEALAGQAAEIYEGLLGEGQAVGVVERSAKLLVGMAQHDESLRALAERAKQAAVELKDVAEDMRVYRDRVEADPQKLEVVEQRLALLERLKKKYGPTLEDVLRFLDQARVSWTELVNYRNVQDSMNEAIRASEAAYLKEAHDLSKRRRTAAAKLTRAVEDELKVLGMAHAKIDMGWTSLDQPAACGLEHAEFLIAPNPGEPPRPLAKVASGGELSRLMLALKVVLAKQDRIPTLIFDEVDAGVGGRTAEVIGKKLKFMSADRQVICVTHMAQIASHADAHYHIVKKVDDHHTTTQATRLTSSREIVEELAKMMSGEPLTPTAVQHAQELLTRAQSEKSEVRSKFLLNS